ncbi:MULTISPECIES: Sec-independent protein translocase protein TatB [Pseudomonadaceae]|jgi:sec-independent protein translocase protein TatB|uniref:Sec-independent protein translocase protein TatB n=2 Tax=Pseudomonadaceae TaxID=135621 RepID=A0A0D7FBS6_9PSED|nr:MULTISPECIES: Sec-independent protein translocase protein TatB [Pseudomonas]EHK70021.1 translocation protein TatB [Pseudomonas psychrotolerans L19]KIZ50614.1 preprotein translocase subunit TatA [Pseudomonas oryzihabitans]KTT54401.1 preprotein translocase subunit TatA [Pseudomonas psychrotolerans]KXJ30606.1 Sec-independent protein translocase TatB [Pseudomonas sp. HUK17]MBA1182235.1 Sec-independent protein translocase subunit TatB [Pseudomonas psychrotolerans]
MFGISFPEMMLVGFVALLVLGPERLPGAARTAGLWIGRLRRSFNSIRQEVEREIGADEIRQQLRNEHILSMEQRDNRPKPAASTPEAQTPPAAVAPPMPQDVVAERPQDPPQTPPRAP